MTVDKSTLELLRSQGVAKYRCDAFEIVFFPDAPEMKVIEQAMDDVKEAVKGCPGCGKIGQRFGLSSSMCDACWKREAGVR